MAYLFALASAGIWGVADFFGGVATRRGSVIPVILLSRITGVVLLAVVVMIFRADPRLSDLAWGAGAGLVGATGLALLYRALAVGAMATVSPVTAVIAASIPVIAGLALGERPSRQAALGVALALIAIALISFESKESDSRGGPRGRALGIAALAGLAIGAFFVFLSRADPAAGLWPLFASRLASLCLFLAVATALRAPFLPRGAALNPALAAALLDVVGTVLFLLSVYRGPWALVAVLTSLSPASTVVLATVVLGERLSLMRVAGLTLSAVAIALIVTG